MFQNSPPIEILSVLDRSLFAKKCSSAGIARWASRDDEQEKTSDTNIILSLDGATLNPRSKAFDRSVVSIHKSESNL
jgi:hypothetical protein